MPYKTDNQPVTTNGVAFFAYLSRDEPNPGTHKTFVFDVDHTNIGGHYSHHTVYLPLPPMVFMSFLGAYTVM